MPLGIHGEILTGEVTLYGLIIMVIEMASTMGIILAYIKTDFMVITAITEEIELILVDQELLDL